MFVLTKTVKSNGKTYQYYQLAESYRKNGKPTHKVLMTLGRVDTMDKSRVDDIVSALDGYTDKIEVLNTVKDCHHHWAKNYGDVYVLEKLWSELGIDTILENLLSEHEYKFDVRAAIKGMVFNRSIDGKSKLSTYEWLEKEVHFPEGNELELHHLYRALDFLVEHKEELESSLYGRLTDLLTFNTSVVFYDTSLVDMYGETPDLVEYSRKGATQFLISLVLSRDGLPLAHEVLPGSTPDISTVKDTVETLKERFTIGRCIFVCDRGMVSREKLKQVKSLGYEYIVGVRLNQWKEVKEEVLTTPGRYLEIKENLKVKEVDMHGKRYIICYNPIQAERDKNTREAVIKILEQEIQGLDPESKKAAALYGHRYKGRFLRRLKDGTLRIDRSQITEDEKYDGKYILLTSEKELSKEEIATTYRRLARIERSFRSLKSLQNLEPVYHHADRRIRAHVTLCVLSHLLERYMEQKLAAEDVEMTASRALEILGRMKAIYTEIKGKSYLFRTEGDSEINDLFRKLHYRPPARVEELGKM